MLVDPEVWTAFHNAKCALVQAIQGSLHSTPHVLSLECSKRDSFRASTRELIIELDTLTSQLEDVATDIDDISKEVQRYYLHTKSSLSLISILPPEVLRDIVRLAVGPCMRPDEIMGLSQVSSSWRTVVNETSELFTKIHWGAFHVNLVYIWQTRAKQQPQIIYLDDDVLEKVFQLDEQWCSYAVDLRHELFEALVNCGHLTVAVMVPETFEVFESWFRHTTASQIRFLSLTMNQNRAAPFAIGPELVSSLRVLELDYVWPTFSGSLSITEMRCKLNPHDSWSEWAVLLRQLPHLEQLSLHLDHFYRLDTTSITPLHIPSLRAFTLRVGSWNEPILRLVRGLVLPDVQHLTMWDVACEEPDTLWDAFVSVLIISGFQFTKIAQMRRVPVCQVSARSLL